MARISVPLIGGLTGGPVIPAQQVTALMRAVPEEWENWAAEDGCELDLATVEALADILRQLADRIDVECIAIATEDA